MEEYKEEADADTETESRAGMESKEEAKAIAFKEWNTANEEEQNIQALIDQVKKAEDLSQAQLEEDKGEAKGEAKMEPQAVEEEKGENGTEPVEEENENEGQEESEEED